MCEIWEVSVFAAVTMEGLYCQGFQVRSPFGPNSFVCCNVELLSQLDINNLPGLCTSDACKSSLMILFLCNLCFMVAVVSSCCFIFGTVNCEFYYVKDCFIYLSIFLSYNILPLVVHESLDHFF